MSAPADDDFPLLTDILEPTPTAPAEAGPEAGAGQVPPLEGLCNPDWEAAEIRLRNRLLGQLAPLLQDRVRTLTADILQQAATRLNTEICLELEQALEELISQTVAEEVARLRQVSLSSLD